MHYNIKQLYTPTLELYEVNERALIIDTETIGTGPTIEIIEIALGDYTGRIVYETLVHPVHNRLPAPAKRDSPRFDAAELARAPYWIDVWPQIARLLDGRLLIAYNAGFDRRALAAECSRYHQSSGERGWRCAMQFVKRTIGTKRPLTLNEACALYQVAGGNHRAGCDVQATYRLLEALKAAAP